MNARPTYGDLRQQLLGLGFEDQSDEYLIFQHPDVRAALLRMAYHDPDEPMLERDVAAARAVLDMNGLMQRVEFDDWVRNQKQQAAS